MPGAAGFRLDEEQRKQVGDALRVAGVWLVETTFDDFIGQIESTIDHFFAIKPEGTFREAHDSLRKLWLRSNEKDPSPALLRKGLKSLPPLALEFLGRRARRVLPSLFPGEIVDGDVFEPPSSFVDRFLAWAEGADGAALVTALHKLSADGGQWVPGRSRGGGVRSAPRLEPQVLGLVRGSPGPKPKGGRPSESARQQMISGLAFAWERGTGSAPDPGRSDKTGFGDLVHAIFEWLNVPKSGPQVTIDLEIEATAEAATYSLRQYWAQVKKVESRSSSHATSSRYCVDCRWMLRRGEGLDDFFCSRMNLACTKARATAQTCGPMGELFEALA